MLKQLQKRFATCCKCFILHITTAIFADISRLLTCSIYNIFIFSREKPLIFCFFLFSTYEPVRDRQTDRQTENGARRAMRPIGGPHNKHKFVAKTIESASRWNCLHTLLIANVFYLRVFIPKINDKNTQKRFTSMVYCFHPTAHTRWEILTSFSLLHYTGWSENVSHINRFLKLFHWHAQK